MNQRDFIRPMVRGAYDLQKLRISTGNRVVANFKAKLGQKPSASEDESLDAAGKELLRQLRASYERITDGITVTPRQKNFKGDELISSFTEFSLVAQYMDLLRDEEAHFRRLGHVLREVPIYIGWLQDVRGVGPAMAGVIISEIDISRAEYPSSLWKYAGLDVAGDGSGRSRKKDHLVDIEYTDKDGNAAKRVGITFNPFLKTKLVGVLGSSFLKSGGEYRQIYDDYKFRLENHERHADKSKGHRHNMAIRYMIKRFLVDLYRKWRILEGLPVAPEYSEAKLGKKHRKAA